MARQFRVARKTKSWSFIQGSQHLFTGNDTRFGAGFSVGETFTIMRILGEYTVAPTTAPTAADVVEVGVGIALVSSDSFAVGSSASPDPIGDEGYPWMYWASHKLHFPSSSLVSGSMEASVRHRIDVKGMRKIRQDQTLAMIVQYVDVVGTPPITVSLASARLLTAD